MRSSMLGMPSGKSSSAWLIIWVFTYVKSVIHRVKLDQAQG
jgi:hypothetical protein